MTKASFLSRFWAWIIDQAVLVLLSFVIAIVFGALVGLLSGSESQFLSFLAGMLTLFMLGLLFLLQFIYFGSQWHHDGQSIGMHVARVKVVLRGTDAAPLSFWRAAFRGTVGYWISGLIFGLGYIWAAFDDHGETWHDKLFDTWVIDVREQPVAAVEEPVEAAEEAEAVVD
jgi:uncharacterized RDD family membrane protein YckC